MNLDRDSVSFLVRLRPTVLGPNLYELAAEFVRSEHPSWAVTEEQITYPDGWVCYRSQYVPVKPARRERERGNLPFYRFIPGAPRLEGRRP